MWADDDKGADGGALPDLGRGIDDSRWVDVRGDLGVFVY